MPGRPDIYVNVKQAPNLLSYGEMKRSGRLPDPYESRHNRGGMARDSSQGLQNREGLSNASCTTNCLAPFVKVLDEEFGIVKGTMSTAHSYTDDQRFLDASHRDLRRACATALYIVPTSTGAAKAVSQLKGKLNGIALRVSPPNVSVVDLMFNTEKKGLTAEDVNNAFRRAADGPLQGILAVCDNPLVHCRLFSHHGHGRRHGEGCCVVRQQVGLQSKGGGFS